MPKEIYGQIGKQASITSNVELCQKYIFIIE